MYVVLFFSYNIAAEPAPPSAVPTAAPSMPPSSHAPSVLPSRIIQLSDLLLAPARSTSSTNEDQSHSHSDYNHSDDEDKQTPAYVRGPGACAWGMEGGITTSFGNSYGERCCWWNKPVIPCAHNGCNAMVHKLC